MREGEVRSSSAAIRFNGHAGVRQGATVDERIGLTPLRGNGVVAAGARLSESGLYETWLAMRPSERCSRGLFSNGGCLRHLERCDGLL